MVAVFLMVLMVGVTSQAADPQKITIAVGGEGMHYFPIYLARGAGFFAEEGLEVDWVNVGSGTRQAAAVMGGSAEMTPFALIHAIKSHVKGANLVAFASVFEVYALTLVLSNEAIQKSGITVTMPIDEKVKRLTGLKIGISSPGSSTDTFIRKLLLARDMDPDKKLTLQPFGKGAAILAAFEQKLSDGFVYVAPIPQIAVQKGLGKIIVDPFSGEIPELKGVPMVVMATSREMLSKKPDLIYAATRAITKAMIFAHERPDDVRKIMRQYFPDLKEDIFNVLVEIYRKGTPKSPVITQEQITKQVAWMNLGTEEPISAKYEGVVATEPAQRAAAELLKR
jgi:NitT/TauT family transport system substrate-binding protein